MRKFWKLSFNKKLKRIYFTTANKIDFVVNKIKDIPYQFKIRTYSPYNVVKVKQLSPEWIERGDLLPHAIFTVLTDYLEKGLHLSLSSPPKKYCEGKEGTEQEQELKNEYTYQLQLWQIYEWYWNHYLPWSKNSVKYITQQNFPQWKDLIEKADGNVFEHLSDERAKKAREHYRKVWEQVEVNMCYEVIKNMKIVCDNSLFMWT